MKKRRILSALLAFITAAGTALGAASVAAAESPYKDVKTGRWSFNEIMYATENGYMNGKGGGLFAPEEVMTRAMVVMVLYRFQGSPKVNYLARFKDVKQGDWYTDAIMWAAEREVVNGVEEGVFAPNDSVTRQQLAAMLMRYAQFEYIKTDNRADITGYKDYKKVQAYARDAMSWANATGLITGVTTTTLEPTSGATREQFAVILKRFKEGERFDYKLAYNEPTVFSQYTEKDYPLVTDADIYVAVDGNDTNPGTLSKPIATFARAKEMVRELKKTAKDEIVVAFKAGNYGVLEGLYFTAEDSGTADVPIRYCAYGDGEVIFQNCAKIPYGDFKPIEESEKYLFNENYYDDIYKVNIADIVGDATTIKTLFSSSNICFEARYPNKKSDGGDQFFKDMTTTVDPYCSIQLQVLLPKIVEGFRTTEGMKVTGVLRVGWLVDTFNVKSYDPETKILTFDTYQGYVPENGYMIGEPGGGGEFMYEGRTSDKVFFHNLSDQLDDNGEYWLDPDTKNLYVYKPDGDYTIATGGRFMTVVDCDYTSFVGLSFDGSNDGHAAIQCSSSDNVNFDLCKLGNVSGQHAMYLEKCLNMNITNCELYNFGAYGLYVIPFWKHIEQEEDFNTSYKALKSSGVVIENNYFHDFGFINTWSDAINLYCNYGTRIAHNYFENGAHAAVEFNASIDTVIEYNVFDNMMMSTQDYGAVYTNWGFEDRGNTIRYNMFKNIRDAGMQHCIYLDGSTCGVEIYGNLFADSGTRGITTNGSRDHMIHDNVYIRWHTSGTFLTSRIYNEEVLEDPTTYEPGSSDYMITLSNPAKLPKEGAPGYDLWRERFPLLYSYNDDISKIGETECIFTTVIYYDNNYIFGDDEIAAEAYVKFGKGTETTKYYDLDENPLFRDPTHGDYRLVDESLIDLPVEKMGRY